MGKNVFANGMEIACKKSDCKVIASFPDVCLSPPSPPAGPIPIPYPDSSFAKDMKKGSKKVKIGGGPVMLKDQSFYKSSPLGNEAATRSFGASVLSHQITGKTFFVAYSFDVKCEGKNVPRHTDVTVSNCASAPGVPGGNLGAMSPQQKLDEKCGKLRSEINKKDKLLGKELRKYDPKKDAKGGFPMKGGKKTKPGGHYIEMRNLQRGMRGDIKRFNKECRDSKVKLGKNVNKQANAEIPPPPGTARIPINV